MHPSTSGRVICVLTVLIAGTAVAEDKPAKKVELSERLMLVRLSASWGPSKGPDGKSKSVSTAVVPQEMVDVVLADAATWYASRIDAGAQEKLLEMLKERIGGRGPSASFQRKRKSDGSIEIGDPRSFVTRELMGGPRVGFEVGVWQPKAQPAKRIKDGYRWKLSWMIQVGWQEHRRRYRIDVALKGALDNESGGIRYQANWVGPYVEEPVDFDQISRVKE